MKAVIDSGSSISKWAVCDDDFNIIEEFQLGGINPTSNPGSVALFSQIPDKFIPTIKEVYYYGSGVSTQASKLSIKDAIDKNLPKVEKIEIENDLLAACRSLSYGTASFVVILGTGTNACLFDGTQVVAKTPSLGFLFDDYGSGYHLGREIIIRFFNNKMSEADYNLFISMYGRDRDSIIQPIYNSDKPNSQIAAYTLFLSECSLALRAQVCSYAFKRFLKKRVNPINNPENCKVINCIGSIAYHFEKELNSACQEQGYEIGTITQNPIIGLLNYYKTR